jgi:NADPH:quinone reductase-like Zn-dependent oxidoreductase
MSNQLVFRLRSRTGHQSFKQVQEAIPTIDKHEVLVKIRAVSLNYRDVVVANGGYPSPLSKIRSFHALMYVISNLLLAHC